MSKNLRMAYSPTGVRTGRVLTHKGSVTLDEVLSKGICKKAVIFNAKTRRRKAGAKAGNKWPAINTAGWVAAHFRLAPLRYRLRNGM